MVFLCTSTLRIPFGCVSRLTSICIAVCLVLDVSQAVKWTLSLLCGTSYLFSTKAQVDITTLWIISSTSYAMEEVHIIAKPCCTQALCLIMANEMWEACLDLRFYLILFFFFSSFYLSWSLSRIQFFSFTLVLETYNLYTNIFLKNRLLFIFLFR